MTSRRGIIREPFYQSPRHATDRPTDRTASRFNWLASIACLQVSSAAATESEVGWSGGRRQ